jgi:hypothetical protein
MHGLASSRWPAGHSDTSDRLRATGGERSMAKAGKALARSTPASIASGTTLRTYTLPYCRPNFVQLIIFIPSVDSHFLLRSSYDTP